MGPTLARSWAALGRFLVARSPLGRSWLGAPIGRALRARSGALGAVPGPSLGVVLESRCATWIQFVTYCGSFEVSFGNRVGPASDQFQSPPIPPTPVDI